MFALLLAATAAFATTNVDSAALILTFCARSKPHNVFVAFAGSGLVVIAASLLIDFTASALPLSPRYLGIFPLVVGMVQFVQNGRQRAERDSLRATTSISIMAMCFLSCSTDNIAVFTAVIAKGGVGNLPLTAGLLCLLYGISGAFCVAAGTCMPRVNERTRLLAPAATVCVGLWMLFL